jgi:hypothetical protein
MIHFGPCPYCDIEVAHDSAYPIFLQINLMLFLNLFTAVKSNNDPTVLKVLFDCGSSFDCASQVSSSSAIKYYPKHNK